MHFKKSLGGFLSWRVRREIALTCRQKRARRLSLFFCKLVTVAAAREKERSVVSSSQFPAKEWKRRKISLNPTLLFFASVGLEQEEEEGEGKRNTEQTQESQVKEREKRLDGFPFKNETRKKSSLNLWEGAASGNHLRASATAKTGNIVWPEIKLAAFFPRRW